MYSCVDLETGAYVLDGLTGEIAVGEWTIFEGLMRKYKNKYGLVKGE